RGETGRSGQCKGKRAHRGQHDLSAMHLDHLYLPVRVVFEGLSSAPGGAAYPLFFVVLCA
ncbi:MAG TPA: hypothetical protein VIQ50_07540, partial [Xanthobacteraceae bacterium]